MLNDSGLMLEINLIGKKINKNPDNISDFSYVYFDFVLVFLKIFEDYCLNVHLYPIKTLSLSLIR